VGGAGVARPNLVLAAILQGSTPTWSKKKPKGVLTGVVVNLIGGVSFKCHQREGRKNNPKSEGRVMILGFGKTTSPCKLVWMGNLSDSAKDGFERTKPRKQKYMGIERMGRVSGLHPAWTITEQGWCGSRQGGTRRTSRLREEGANAAVGKFFEGKRKPSKGGERRDTKPTEIWDFPGKKGKKGLQGG